MTGVFSTRARGQGKSARTRARLMDAAAEAFARKGIEAASINGIAQAADVSNGTFYNHFRDKDELVATVAFGILYDLAERIDEAMRDLRDPAERVCFGTRQIIELAAREPVWGHALCRAAWSMPDLRREVVQRARADLELGAREGVFRVEVDDLLVDVFSSMVLMGVIRRLGEDGGPEVGPRVAEHQLRMLGVPPARARRAARRPITPLLVRDRID